MEEERTSYQVNHLAQLESEAIFILRETASQFERPALLFQEEKTPSSWPTSPVRHFIRRVSRFRFCTSIPATTFKKPSTTGTSMSPSSGGTFVITYVQDSIDQGRVQEEKGPFASRNILQTVSLLDAIEANKYNAFSLGGGRRDEESTGQRAFFLPPG